MKDFTEYLKEDKKLEDILSTINRECYQWARNPVMLYRGSTRKVKDFLKIKSHLKDRKPLTSSEDFHNAVNKMFIKKFGWPVRNGVFVYRRNDALGYGDINIFIPIGKFKYVWSPSVADLYARVPAAKWKEYPEGAKEDYERDIRTAIDRFQKVFLDTYTDKNIQAAAAVHDEISVKCDEYFLVNMKYEKEIILNFQISRKF